MLITTKVRLEVVDNKGTVLLKVTYSRRNKPQGNTIEVYGTGEDTPHLADMDLERSAQYKGMVSMVHQH